MKSAFFLAPAAIVLCMVLSCNRQANSDPGDNTPTPVDNPVITHGNARLLADGYSQPIALDTANKMIGSYLASVKYPQRDTAVRSLAFSADTIRAYLKDSRITSLEFYMAHQLSYLNGGNNRFGKNVGMKPGALTIIMVGLDNNGAVIRNTSNGVYEHAMPCPNMCPTAEDAFLH